MTIEPLLASMVDGLPWNERKEQFSIGFVRLVVGAAGCWVKTHSTDFDGVDITIVSSAEYATFYCPEFELQLKCTAQQDLVREDVVAWTMSEKPFTKLTNPKRYTPAYLGVLMVPDDPDGWLEQVAAALTPSAVSEFLRACDAWNLEGRTDHLKEIWAHPASGDGPRARLMLPLATDYADYEQRFADALRAISIVSNWGADELLLRIISSNADLFFVHLDQAQADDTIPLRQAEATVDAICEMVKAAAITADNPYRNQRGGRLPSAVSAFLEEDVRLGHTKRGSFVFTVVSRLDSSSARVPSAVADVASVFPRRVMETLARGIETTRDLAQGKTVTSLGDPAQTGLSAALVESLEDLVKPEDLRSLELSFQWANTRTRPTVGTKPIRLEHSEVRELSRVRELLIRQEEPPHRETLFGMVKELARADGTESEDAGSVVISAEVNGRRRNVHMILSGADHRRAIESYRHRLPLIVSGDLVFEHQAWRLVGDIEVDARLIERGR